MPREVQKIDQNPYFSTFYKYFRFFFIVIKLLIINGNHKNDYVLFGFVNLCSQKTVAHQIKLLGSDNDRRIDSVLHENMLFWPAA